MVHITNVMFPHVSNALQKFGARVKGIVPKKPIDNGNNKNKNSSNPNEVEHSDIQPQTPQEKTDGAVKKFNASNEQRIIAATNSFAEIDNDCMLLQEYCAYRNADFKNTTFTPVSEDTISGKYRGKDVEIKLTDNNDGKQTQEINFEDGSKISYLIYSENGKMDINGEEFEMPAGTIVETKTAQGKVFSKLIQTPDMARTVVELPIMPDSVQEILDSYNSAKGKPPVMPTPEYMQNLLGSMKGGFKPLSYLSGETITQPQRTPENEVAYLNKSIAEGKLPQGTTITGVKEDGGKILSISGENCTYEVCGSEMRVLDNNGEVKMLAKYDSSRTSLGLWVVSYDNGKPISGARYSAGNPEPIYKVNYTYHDNGTISAVSSEGTKTLKIPSDGVYLNIDGGLKFVSKEQTHLGARFENQTHFTV